VGRNIAHTRPHTLVCGTRAAGDIYSNDGDGDMPVINLSIGASSCFGVTLLLPDKTSQRFGVELRSGDAILFGGPSRFIEHAVLGVMLDKKPTWMTEDPCRMSLTFRAAPSVSGREEFFRNFKIKGDWCGTARPFGPRPLPPPHLLLRACSEPSLLITVRFRYIR
jgi:hypothetical protein